MLAHSKIVIGAPYCDLLFLAIVQSSDCFGEFVFLSLNINKLSVPSFFFQSFHVFSKDFVIVETFDLYLFDLLLSKVRTLRFLYLRLGFIVR